MAKAVKVTRHKRKAKDNIIEVRIEADPIITPNIPNTWMVVVGKRGYPSTVGYVEGFGKTYMISTIRDAKAIAREVAKEVQEANPDATVIVYG